MKHSFSNDDFLMKRLPAVGGDIARSGHDSSESNKYDICMQFEEFLQERENKYHHRVSSGCTCKTCTNFEELLKLDKMRHHKYEHDMVSHNQINNFMMSQNKSGHFTDKLACSNLNQCNSPVAPYRDCSCNQCFMNFKESMNGCVYHPCISSPNTISTHISPNESNQRGMCSLGAYPPLFLKPPHIHNPTSAKHDRTSSQYDLSKCSIPKYSNMSHSNKSMIPDNILMKKLLMKRTIQTYFMTSKECCSLCKSKSDPFKMIQKNLDTKYLTGMDYYNVKVINDIIYNDTTNLVSLFKDYLIYDDISEFLKRYYRDDESYPRLLKIYSFYDKYSKVFPNYIALEENKYMFKNIERKQIAIDERQQFFQELEEKEKDPQQTKNSNLSQIFANESNRLFDSKFVNSVNNIKTNSEITDTYPFDVVSKILDSRIQNRSDLNESKNKSRTIRMDSTFEENNHKPKKEILYKRLEDYNLVELVEKFLLKDNSINDTKFTDESKLKKTEEIPKSLLIKEQYNQERKQGKRSKSSGNTNANNQNKVGFYQPIIFSTIDNRKDTQNVVYKSINREMNIQSPNCYLSPSQSPNKINVKNKQNYEILQIFKNNKSVKQIIPIKSKLEKQGKIVKVYPYQFKKTEGDIITFAKNVFKQYETNRTGDVESVNSPPKTEVIECNKKIANKFNAKTERLKFKRLQEKPVKKDNILNIVRTTQSSCDLQNAANLKNYDTCTGFDSSSNTFKWTMKSRDIDKTSYKGKHIDDFEKLFYQSMSNEKGVIVSHKGIDYSQIKNSKAQNTSQYKSLSKSKSTKHIKNK